MTGVALSIVIPAYDEGQRLGASLDRIAVYLATRTFASEVIVVDDGSRDDTAAIARVAGVRVVTHAVNRGKGAAIRTGALVADGARILLCDADLATPIEELPRLEAALDGGADLAIGSRHLAPGSIEVEQPLPRRVLGAGFRGLVRVVTGVAVRDPMCGFKLLTRAAARDLMPGLRVERFAYDVELLDRARDRWRIVEVPVTWRHVDGSRVALRHDSLRAAADLVAIRLRRRR